MTTEDHLTPTENVRKLRFMPSIQDSYEDGSHVYVQDSSAMDHSIWLRAIGRTIKLRAIGRTIKSTESVEVSIHLRAEDAVKLAEQVLFLAGEEGGPRNHLAEAQAFVDGFKAARAHPDWRLLESP